MVKNIAIGGEVWGLIPGPIKSDTVSPTARNRCDVSLELLCCPEARPLRWVPPLVTRFGVWCREYDEDFKSEVLKTVLQRE